MKIELEIKGTKDELNGVILVLVNSGYNVNWETKKAGKSNHKVLVVDDRKGVV